MARSPAAYVLGSAELGPCRAFARQHHAPAARRRTREACWRTCVHVYRRPFGRGMLAAASRRTCEASVVADMFKHAEVTGGGCIQQQGQGMGLSSAASPLKYQRFLGSCQDAASSMSRNEVLVCFTQLKDGNIFVHRKSPWQRSRRRRTRPKTMGRPGNLGSCCTCSGSLGSQLSGRCWRG